MIHPLIFAGQVLPGDPGRAILGHLAAPKAVAALDHQLGVDRPLAVLDAWWEAVSPRRRLDRNAGNMCMLIGLMLPSLSIVLRGPVPNSVLADMPENLQIGMCACIFGGCSIKVHGALSGSRWYFPHTSLEQSYRWGYAGAPAATMGLWVYGYYTLSNTPNFWSALAAVATPLYGVGIGVQAVFYWLESRRIERNETILTEQLMNRIDCKHDDP